MKDAQHNNTLLLWWVSLCWVSRLIHRYGECHFSECHSAECHSAESRYGECRSAEWPFAESGYGECCCADCHGAITNRKSSSYIIGKPTAKAMFVEQSR